MKTLKNTIKDIKEHWLLYFGLLGYILFLYMGFDMLAGYVGNFASFMIILGGFVVPLLISCFKI